MLRNASVAAQQRFNALMVEFQNAAANNLDESEKFLIERIARSAEAPQIFAKIDDTMTAKRILSLCVQTHFLATHFNGMLDDAERALDSEATVQRAIETIEQLLSATQNPPLNRLTASATPDPGTIAVELRAMVSIRRRLEDQIRIAKETILRLGATNKSRGEKAAEVAAIGWMAEGIKRITKKTNTRLAADLAELVLGCEVSVDRVNNAAETRKREWRMPL